MECLLLSAKHSRSLVWWENTLRAAIRRTIWRTHKSIWFEDRISPCICQRLVKTHSSVMSCTRGGIRKGDFLVVDIEELEQMDASEIHAWRLSAKEVLTPENGEKCFPDRRWKSKTIQRRSGSENIHLNPGQPWTRRRAGRSSRRIRRVSPSQDSSPGDGEARNDFWFISWYYIHRRHVEPRVKLHVPREESFPLPLRHIDVTRATSTTLDVMLECRIDDYWNIEGDRDQSDAWTGLTRFTILDEKPPDGFSWSRGRLTKKKKQHPDQITCGQKDGHYVRRKSTQRKTKVGYRKTKARQCEKVERCLLHRSSRCGVQGNCEKCEERVGSSDARPASMLCKIRRNKYGETCSTLDTRKSKYACIVEADESTRKRLEETLH